MDLRRTGIGAATATFIAMALIVVGAVGALTLSYWNSPSHSSLSPLTHQVAFKQTAACSSSFWGAPWAVTVNNMTRAQPAGTRLPISYLYGTTDRSLAEIDFSLLNGDYQYTVNPLGYFSPSSGSFVVSGSNITIPIAYEGTSCTTTVGSTESPGSPIPISSAEVANISIGGSPRTIAIDTSTDRIYVADYFSNNLTVVDSATNSVVATVPLPAGNNNGIAIDPNTDMIYVLVQGGVAVVNGTTNTVVEELHLDFGPGSLAYDPSTHIIYGSPEAGGSLVGADVRTGKIALSVPLGFWANSVTVNPQTHVIFAVGCDQQGMVCNSVASMVNGTSGKVLNNVSIGNDAYPRVTMNLATDVVYISGSAQLVALNGTTGKMFYEVESLVCGPFDSMAADTSTNQLFAVTLGNYLMVYNGTSGALSDMYSFPSSPQYASFDANTGLWYVTDGSQLLAFQSIAGVGHFNSALTGSGQNCGLP